MTPTYQELLQSCLTELETTTNITQLGPGSKARALLEIINARLAAAYQYFDNQLANVFLATAQGHYLDLLGDLLACPRRAAKAAEVDAAEENLCFYVSAGTFGDLTGGQPLTVPAGTLISTAPLTSQTRRPVVYRLWEEVTLPANGQRVFISATADTPGTQGNVGRRALRHHSLRAYPNLLVTNLEGIANGVDLEDDDAYRQRLAQQVFAAATANLTAIRLACLSVPGVEHAVAHLHARGAGTVDLYITATYGYPSASLLAQVQLALEQQQALGVRCLARAPRLLGVQLATTVSVDQTLNTQERQALVQQLEQRARRYFRGLKPGDPFIVNLLVSDMLHGLKGVRNLGSASRPFQEMYLWQPSRQAGGRRRYHLAGDYYPAFNEWLQLEEQDDLLPLSFRLS